MRPAAVVPYCHTRRQLTRRRRRSLLAVLGAWRY